MEEARWTMHLQRHWRVSRRIANLAPGIKAELVWHRYTYEFCFFEEAKQKPTKGGMNFGLG